MKKSKTKKSFGLACVRFNIQLNRMEILMIKKRNSFAFMDFVLGNYKIHDLLHLKELFDNMNNPEKLDIASLNFSKIWYRAFLKSPDDHRVRFNNNDIHLYNRYKKFFSKLIENNERKILNLLSQSIGRDSMWEIPKGKKENGQESELSCAIREFEEETGIPAENFHILNNLDPISFTKNSHKFCYINKYYLAIEKIPYDKKLKLTRTYPLNYSNRNQLTEVIGIKWLGVEDLKSEINSDFHDLTKKIFKIVNKDTQLIKNTKIKSILNSEIKEQDLKNH